MFFGFVCLVFLFDQDRKAVEKRKEQDKAKEKQQEELSKQRQIEKVIFKFKTFSIQKQLKVTLMVSLSTATVISVSVLDHLSAL